MRISDWSSDVCSSDLVQFGGQTPLKLAQALEDAGIPILGTSPDEIDLAEDRERFAALVPKLKLKQPENGIARSREEAIAVANRIGYPVRIRHSSVLEFGKASCREKVCQTW